MKAVLIAVGGLAAAGLFAAERLLVLPPLDNLRPGALVLFVGDCPFAWRSFQNLQSAALQIRDRVVAVPVAGNGRVVAEVCRATVTTLRQARPWFWLRSSSSLCRGLVRDATAFHGKEFAALPALSVGRQPVDFEAEEIVGRALNIDLSRDEQGGYQFKDGARALEPRVGKASAETVQPVNQPLDW